MEFVQPRDVLIPEKFKQQEPKASKTDKIIRYIAAHDQVDVPIVIDNAGILQDGYARYYTWTKLLGRTDPIWCVRRSEKVIGATFFGHDELYYWSNPDNIEVEVGDLVLVQNRESISLVRVECIEERSTKLTKKILENVSKTESLWVYAVAILNYIGIPVSNGVSFWQNIQSGHFAYQYQDGNIKEMTEEQSLTFDALGWLNDMFNRW